MSKTIDLSTPLLNQSKSGSHFTFGIHTKASRTLRDNLIDNIDLHEFKGTINVWNDYVRHLLYFMKPIETEHGRAHGWDKTKEKELNSIKDLDIEMFWSKKIKHITNSICYNVWEFYWDNIFNNDCFNHRYFADPYLFGKVTVPNTVVDIKNMAFAGQFMRELVFEGDTNKVGRFTAAMCPCLTKVEFKTPIHNKYKIEKDETEMGEKDCLKSPDDGKGMFYYCLKLKEVNFENIHPADDMFRGCGFETIKIPKNWLIIPKHCFCENYELTILDLSEFSGEIQESAFKNCKKLKIIIWGKGKYKINDEAFADCPCANGLVIDERFESIDRYVFDCLGGDTITIKNNKPNWTALDWNWTFNLAKESEITFIFDLQSKFPYLHTGIKLGGFEGDDWRKPYNFNCVLNFKVLSNTGDLKISWFRWEFANEEELKDYNLKINLFISKNNINKDKIKEEWKDVYHSIKEVD